MGLALIGIKKIRDHAVQMVKDKKWECDIGPFVETVILRVRGLLWFS